MIYVLAVGIDTYSGPSGVPPLNGCAMDAWRFLQFLKNTFGSDQVQELFLHNNQGKRQALIDGLSNHLGQAGPDDLAIFYYSGHGSREASAPEFRKFFPDGMDETIVCFDSRTDGVHDLADKELAVLMAKIAENGPDIVAILDKCHSGSAFRGVGEALGLIPKQVGSLDKERPLDSYIGFPEFFSAEKADIPENSMIALTACDRYQRAYQDPESGGIFTSALLRTLERLRDGGQLQQTSYADLFFKLRLAIRHIVDNQTPQLEVYGQYNAHTVLFKRGETSEAFRYSVYTEPGRSGWRLNAGALHGLISDPDILEKGRIAIFDDGQPCGEARLKAINVVNAELKLSQGTKLETGKTYQAELVNVFVDPLAIALVVGNTAEATVAAVRAAADGGQYAFADPAAAAKYRLELHPEGYTLRLHASGTILYASAPRHSGWTWDEAAVALLGSQLRKVAAWERVLHLNNPRAIEIGEKLQLSFILDKDGTTFANDEVTLAIPDEWVKNRRGLDYRLNIRNSTRANLKMMALYLNPNFAIAAQEEEPLAKKKDQTVRKKIIGITDPQLLEETDIYKVVIAHGSQTLDSQLFTQSSLEESARSVRGEVRQLKKINRNFWTTKTLVVHSVRELAIYRGETLSLPFTDLQLAPHPALRGRVALRTGQYLAPSLEPAQVLISLAEKRGWPVLDLASSGGQDCRVLELYELEGIDEVTARQPFTVLLPDAPPKGAKMVALAFNGYEPVVCGEGRKVDNSTALVIPRIFANHHHFRKPGAMLSVCVLKLTPAQLKSPEFLQMRSVI